MSFANMALKDFQKISGAYKKLTDSLKNSTKTIASLGATFINTAKIADEANEIIRNGTGLTGAKLNELVQSFEEVGKQVPNHLNEVAQAITKLSSESGATGAQLEGLAAATLHVSRLMGVDSSNMISNSVKVMKTWGISVAESTGMMDKLLLSSKHSGVAIQDLSSKMIEHGSSLQKMGFSFEQSTALLSKWQKEGTNTTEIMDTMEKAFTEFSKRSKLAEPAQAFQELIHKIENAESKTQALKIASSTLGKAGKSLGKEISNGALALDKELVAALQSSSGAIERQVKATSTLSQRWGIMKNNLLLAMPVMFEFVKKSVISLGTSFIDAANKSHAAYKTIRVGTGATGEQLTSLLNSYKNIGKQVPDDLNQVARVIVGLKHKTGATGTELETLAKTTLDLSRLIGVDSSELISASSDVMKTWNISLQDSAGMMDKLLVASQSTGVGLTGLGTHMKEQGEALQKMGFSFDQSLAFLAQWEKDGVNAKDMVETLNTAFTTLSQADGITNPVKEFQSLVQQMETTTDQGEAMRQALNSVGKSGESMADAIRKGSLALNQDLYQSLTASSGAIAQQVKETMTLGEKWGVVSNQLSIAIAPIGELMLGIAEKAIPYLGSLINWLAERSSILIPGLVGMSAVIMGALIPSLWASAVAGWAAIAPFLPIIALALAVGVAFAGLAYLFQKHSESIKEAVLSVFEDIKLRFTLISQLLTGDISGAWNTFMEMINKSIRSLNKILSAIGIDTIDYQFEINKNVQANTATSSATPTPAGSHYHGLDYVPYDGYLARLHKGERVLNAQENMVYTNGTGGSVNISITGNTFHVRQESDIDSIARALAREIKAAGGLMA